MSRVFALFRRDRAGVISIEFAVVAPVMALMALGAIEILSYSSGLGRVDDAAQAVGMMVSRVERIDDRGVGGAFDAADAVTGAGGIGQGLRPRTLRVTSAIACPCAPDSEDLCFRTLWSRERTGGGDVGAGLAQSAPVPAAPGEAATRAGETVIVTEALYDYRPTLRVLSELRRIDARSTQIHTPTLGGRVVFGTDPGPATCADLGGT